jgi:hypothetical protein
MRIAIVCVVVAAVSSSTAFAQPAGAQAEVLFRQGRELMAANKITEACNAFAESQKLQPDIATLLNLAGCREKQGALATAWGLFLDAERQTRGTDAASQQLHAAALDHSKKLEPRISKLTINVPQQSQIDGLEVKRGDERIDAALWNRALPIDGGTYTVSAHAPGTATWSATITVGREADTKTIDIPDLRSLPRDVVPAPTTAATTAPVPVASAPVDHVEHSDGSGGNGTSRVLPITISAVAVALLGGALAFDLWGNSTYNDAKAEMTSQSQRDSLYDSANDKRYTSIGFLAGGAAAAGVAVWLFVRGEHADSNATAIVPTSSGVAVFGHF